MTQIRKHNPVLEQRLQGFLAEIDIVGLRTYLENLSNTEFRTAGYLLAEHLLPVLDNTAFWQCFVGLVPFHSKAYLGTFLKAMTVLYTTEKLTVDAEELTVFAQSATPIDKRKILESLLPVLRTPEEVVHLLRLFCEDRPQARIAVLLPVGTAPCYYELFRNFKQIDHLPVILHRYCLQLMSRGDKIGFNLACITKEYFGLDTLPGTFSLRLEQYQLSRLDENYINFQKILLN